MAYIHTTVTVLNRSAIEVVDRIEKLDDIMIVECPDETFIQSLDKTDINFQFGASNLTLLYDTSIYTHLVDELLFLLAEHKIEAVSFSLDVPYRIKVVHSKVL